jgi:hypothetical protein
MDDVWMRLMENMSDRVSGPMKLRFVLQPLMACIFAIIDGLKDAKAGKPPYGWALFTDAVHRADMIKDGWKSIGKVFIIALVLDLGFQIFFADAIFPGESLMVAFMLAIVPYMILRGPINRIARRK